MFRILAFDEPFSLLPVFNAEATSGAGASGLSPKDMVGIHQLGKNREGDIVFLDVGGTVEFLETFYDS